MLAPWFAIAGLAAAAGPILIHLLNRRRWKPVKWAAMDFLRKAVQRNRKILQWRDLLLLLVRCCVLMLFGLALARPYWGGTGDQAAASGQAVHAVLLVDNSLSMAYQQLDGTLLDEAKSKAEAFIEQLPAGSRISVVPLAGGNLAVSQDPYRSRQDAKDAIQQIETVDASAPLSQVVNLAREALGQASDIPAKRVVLLSDQQAINWPAGDLSETLAGLPELQVVSITPDKPENSSISELRLIDEVADTETATRVLVEVKHDGPSPRRDVAVRLLVDGEESEVQTVDLEPGSTRQLEFVHKFETQVDPGQPAYVPVTVELSSDSLPDDDHRTLIVPVVAALPVVFIDEIGSDEDPRQNRYGETYTLRRLLAPVGRAASSTTGFGNRQLVEIRHLRPDDVTQMALQDARLVVVAGLERPAGLVPMLHDYVRQGGPLVICAGGNFDPAAWNEAAWLDGDGILPVPLAPEPIGHTPDTGSADLVAFRLDPETMIGGGAVAQSLFRIPQVSDDQLADLYRSAYFFKAVRPQMNEETLTALVTKTTEDVTEFREERESLRKQVSEWEALESQRPLTAEEKAQADAAVDALEKLDPTWLVWQRERQDPLETLLPEEVARARAPRMLAGFDNDAAFLVDRGLGRGRIVFASSGVTSNWNSLTRTNAIVIFDRLLRDLIEDTVAERNFVTGEPIVLPVPAADRYRDLVLIRPNGLQQGVAVEALGGDRSGLVVRGAADRGVYTIEEIRSGEPSERLPFATVALSVNGPAEESQLTTVPESDIQSRSGETQLLFLSGTEQISLEGAAMGQSLWWWLLAAVLLLVLLEMSLVHSTMAQRGLPAPVLATKTTGGVR